MKLSDFGKFDINELRNLDFRNPGDWPGSARGIAYVVIFVLVLLIGYYFWLSNDKQDLNQGQQQEQKLRSEFKDKALQAANIKEYHEQLEQLTRTFNTMKLQLPGKTEIPNVLQDISQTAQIDGLKQDLFKPLAEVKKDFYAEDPIQIQLEGSYHQFGKFVSDVSALPRIVTVHDIGIKPQSNAGQVDELVMTLTAQTYRYLEPGEEVKLVKKKPR
ncbi:MAG: type 4a pilus biogenesis protein PilO [Gammaproteobacteria bacterium]